MASNKNDSKAVDSVLIETTQDLDSNMKQFIREAKQKPVDEAIQTLHKIIKSLLSFNKLNKNLFTHFQKYLDRQDILQLCWQILPDLTPKKISLSNTTFVENLLELISSALNKNLVGDLIDGSCIIYTTGNTDIWNYDYSKIKRNINKTWMNIMQWNCQQEHIHRQVLIILLEKCMPHIAKPLLLTDFFMESLNVGGPISLLGFQGIFILIQYHNLTCPDIYEKLYAMFEPEIFHTKFKSRLFYLADIFLTSTHLPEILVAAFAKRLARLSLIAPPQDIVIIISFVGNLIIRHSGLKVLLNKQSGGTVESDPYVMDEPRPSESNAMSSSLWEIAAMQHHVLPSISSTAKSLFNSLPSQEYDLAPLLDSNDNSLFEVEARKQYKTYPINYETINNMFIPNDDRIKTYWNLF